MDNQQIEQNTPSLYGNWLFSKDALIIILLVILIFSFLGISILSSTGNILKTLFSFIETIVAQLLSLLGYTTGTIIDKSSEVIADTTKTGIDIADGTLQSIGELLIKSSTGNVNTDYKSQLDNLLRQQKAASAPPAPEEKHNEPPHNEPPPNDTSINKSPNPPANPHNDTSASPIQNPITSSKQNWCLVGEYQGRRGCISINDNDKCLSGQVFPSQTTCLNPTQSNNVAPFLKAISEKTEYQPRG